MPGGLCRRPCENGTMTRPDPRQQAALSAAFAGAIDLSGLKRPAAAAPSGPAAPAAGQTTDGETTPFVIDVDEQTFGDAVQVSADVPVVIELWASRADRSQQVSAALEKAAAAAGGSWVLARVDIDANPRIAQAFGIQSLPTTVALAGGQPVDMFTGVMPEAEALQWISGLLDALRDRLPGIRAAEEANQANSAAEPEPEDPRLVAAEDAMAAGDFAGAAQAYQEILAVEPTHQQAASALLWAQFLGRVQEAGPDAIAAADAAPNDVAAQCAAADLQVSEDDAAGGFARLVDTVRRSADPDRTIAREHLLELFGLFPADDAAVIAARRALAAALY